MTIDTLLSLAAFAFVASITPGPNNLMLMASGTNFGFQRTIPHMLGVGLGFVFMVMVVGTGLAELFDRYPLSHTVLKIVSTVYLLYLAWRIAGATAPGTTKATGVPFTFWQAAAFQWVNPKAWAMALSAVSVYSTSHAFGEIIVISIVFGLINLPSVSSWTLLGQGMRRFLNQPVRLLWFNRTMAVLLVLSLWPILLPQV